MLALKHIVKDYTAGDTQVRALKGVSLEFRKHEFVSILGPSGCGKTTLLNIIGGLDQYTDGDLVINGKSTKDFRDGDWDTYRNHSVGFVFQSYNLIPHQSVLSNVELALTLSGVSKAERRKRATDALTQVGLGDQLHKRPNQMSGGQMQRVAIARALVNDPDILLADEPTGALDSTTSVQIMELLKSISKDKLIIMVTHNPDLAAQYSSRIIRLLDGKITDDTNPYRSEAAQPAATQSRKEQKALRKPSMSFLTALTLSLNNLMTKKGRTILTAFAGSIGIIGIALILSISTGVQNYIDQVQEDTLSTYPLTIESTATDLAKLMGSLAETRISDDTHDLERVYSDNTMTKLLNSMIAEITSNDLKSFREFLESGETNIKELSSDIQYGYSTQLNVFAADTSDGITQVNPSTFMEALGMGNMSAMMEANPMMQMSSSMSSMDVWAEMLGNEALLSSQYDVIAGRMPEDFDEVVLVVDEDNELDDYTLYTLGLKEQSELREMYKELQQGNTVEAESVDYSYDELLSLTFRLVPSCDFYEEQDGIWIDRREDDASYKELVDNGLELRVVGILRPNEDATAQSISGAVGYTTALMEYLIGEINGSEVVKAQIDNPDTDIFTGLPFEDADGGTDDMGGMPDVDPAGGMPDADPAGGMPDVDLIGGLGGMLGMDMESLTDEQRAYLATLSEEQLAALQSQYAGTQSTTATYDGNLALLGVADLSEPSSISIYPKDFASKEDITEIIDSYNNRMRAEGKDENVIQYTDYIGLMMSSITTIITAISYVLIAFVAISLVVSSIMIGIITYISVLERTKEIGILRSIGASKRDISRVFNAETLIVGFVAGALGILITLLFTLPINALIYSLSGVSLKAVLPLGGAVILVAISMFLTFIAGLIPSKVAARKDPVVALRSE